MIKNKHREKRENIKERKIEIYYKAKKQRKEEKRQSLLKKTQHKEE